MSCIVRSKAAHRCILFREKAALRIIEWLRPGVISSEACSTRQLGSSSILRIHSTAIILIAATSFKWSTISNGISPPKSLELESQSGFRITFHNTVTSVLPSWRRPFSDELRKNHPFNRPITFHNTLRTGTEPQQLIGTELRSSFHRSFQSRSCLSRNSFPKRTDGRFRSLLIAII